MSRRTLAARTLALTALAVTLSGCITVFPKTKPAQLYRFGEMAAAESTPGTATRVGVARMRGTFNAAAATDRIMTVTGTQVAYVAEARWAEPASLMFEEAMTRAFAASTGPARLVGRGDNSRTAYALRLDVDRFEAAYDHGAKAAPEVRIDAHLVLVKSDDRTVIRDEIVSSRARAADNRVGAIVSAFDTATKDLMAKVVAATDAGVGG